MKHTKNRVAALLLALAMVLSLAPMAFAAEEFPDMPAESDPSYAAVKSAVDNDIMTGDNGMLNLEDTILRSTVSKMLVMVFAAKGEADLSVYPDVEDGQWYVDWMSKANQMGIMNGSNGKMEPGREVTLAEVAVMLARALGLPMDETATIDGVAAWAAPAMDALIKAGYIADAAGAHEPMTRVEFAEVIYKVSGGNYVKEGGEYTEDVNGNIVITADGVSLKGITVKGDVIIADGVDAGTINLDGVKIDGRLVVRGGSEVALTNGTTAASTVVAKTSDEVTVSADKTSDAGAITVDAKADKVTVDMPEPNVTVASATEVAVQNAEGGSVTLAASGASVAVESGSLENITVYDGASDVKVDVAEGATIENITTNEDVTVTGEGTVSEVTGSGVVSDEAGEVIGGGDDEPADVPTVSGGSTAPEGPAAPAQPAHVHNYVVPEDGSATQLNATHHLVACVNKAAVEANPDADPPVAAQPAIVGCGATVAMPHTPNEETGVCTACGYKKSTTTSTKDEVEDEGDGFCTGGHVWDNGTVAGYAEGKNACTADTVITYHCTKEVGEGDEKDTCAATYTETITAKGHNYLPYNSKEATETKTATCKEDGKKSYKCADADCNHVYTETIKKESVAHTLVRDTTQDQAGTCQAGAVEGWKCSVCNASQNKTLAIDSTAHVWPTTWTQGTDDDGNEIHTRICTACSTAKQTHSPTPAASWSSSDSNHWHICTVAGCTVKVGDEAHAYAEGGKACTSCGKPKPASSAPAEPQGDHNWVNGKCTLTSNGHNPNTCTCTNANHAADVAAKFTPQEGCSICRAKGTKDVNTCDNKDTHSAWPTATADDSVCPTCGTKVTHVHKYVGGQKGKHGACACGQACPEGDNCGCGYEAPDPA